MTVEEIRLEAESLGFALIPKLPYYTVNTLSTRLGHSRRTVEKWVSKLPHVKMGKTIKFDYNEIERRLACKARGHSSYVIRPQELNLSATTLATTRQGITHNFGAVLPFGGRALFSFMGAE